MYFKNVSMIPIITYNIIYINILLIAYLSTIETLMQIYLHFSMIFFNEILYVNRQNEQNKIHVLFVIQYNSTEEICYL